MLSKYMVLVDSLKVWTDNMLWPGGHYGLGECLIRGSQDLAYVGQHDLQIKAINKSNTYMLSMSPASCIDCQ